MTKIKNNYDGWVKLKGAQEREDSLNEELK